ncbi:MAG: hypothetical protein HY000_10045, partial [Planctomycetes bacterium]|nr:hypothetical protein [Planctomycetota bacterium]
MPTRNNERRAVISGVGLITPLGTSKAQVWKNWAAGHCAAALVRQFDVSTLPSRIASEVADFVPQQHIKNRKLLKLLRRGEDFAIAAAKAALEDAQVRPAGLDSARCGVAVGCSKEGPPVENFFAGIEVALDAAGQIDRARFADEGLPLIPPLTIIEGLPNACLYYLVESFHLEGANHNFLSYGAGAALALGEAFRSIQRGDADQMLAGGFDSWVNWVSLSFLAEMGLLTRANERPQQAHRPFDAARSGSVAGEGAGFTV